MPELGRLTRIELRRIWAQEAKDFTPSLAQNENLAVLAETLGLELELQAQETQVGPFRADLLCKNADGGSWVLIENGCGSFASTVPRGFRGSATSMARAT